MLRATFLKACLRLETGSRANAVEATSRKEQYVYAEILATGKFSDPQRGPEPRTAMRKSPKARTNSIAGSNKRNLEDF